MRPEFFRVLRRIHLLSIDTPRVSPVFAFSHAQALFGRRNSRIGSHGARIVARRIFGWNRKLIRIATVKLQNLLVSEVKLYSQVLISKFLKIWWDQIFIYNKIFPIDFRRVKKLTKSRKLKAKSQQFWWKKNEKAESFKEKAEKKAFKKIFVNVLKDSKK